MQSDSFKRLVAGTSAPTASSSLSLRERANQLRNIQPAPQPEKKPGFFDRLKETGGDILDTLSGAGEAVGKRAGNIGQTIKKTVSGEINPLSGITQSAGNVAGLFNDISGELYTGVGKTLLPQEAEDKVKEKIANIAKEIASLNTIKQGTQAWRTMEEKHPELAGNIRALTNMGLAYADVFGVGKAGTVAQKGVNKADDAIRSGINTTKRTAAEITEQAKTFTEPVKRGFQVVKNKLDDISKKNPAEVVIEKAKATQTRLEDIVSPKFNIGEKVKAIKEKRIKTGPDFPTLGKAPDIIAPSRSTRKITDTLRKYVDDADKLDQYQIVEQADNITKELAKDIRPRLEVVPFTSSQKRELVSEWAYLRSKQKKSIFYGSPSSKKFQEVTNNYLRHITKKVKDESGQFREWTMADLWDFRIGYDNLSDVKRIKKLLGKKDLTGDEQLLVDMWLENREMLNQFIKDEAEKIGEDVGKKWADMSDFYTIIDNISTKADIDLTGEPDIIRKFITIPTKIRR